MFLFQKKREKRSLFSPFNVAFLAFISIILLLNSEVFSAQVTLSWNTNNEADLAGYRLYYKTSINNFNKNNFDEKFNVGNKTNHTVQDLESGITYFFAITAYDFSGNESNISSIASYTVPGSTSTPPSDDCTLDFKFQKTTVQNGMDYYTDRSYSFTNVPSKYIGMEMIKTPNDDKGNTCGSGYMEFTMPKTATVYIAYDRRATDLPDWINGFNDTGDRINVSRALQGWMTVYSKQFSGGECVNFGCNKGRSFSGSSINNYIVFYGTSGSEQTGGSSDNCDLDAKFHRTTVQNGMNYYTDRSYSFTNVPSKYIGMEMIKTPNDDKGNTCGSGYMEFTMPKTATVYIAYDRRATDLPDWINGFNDTGDRINVSRALQGWMTVYSKQFSGGECVNFGCNKGRGFSGSSINNYIVFYGTSGSEQTGGSSDNCDLDAKFHRTTVQNGMNYYTDRSYSFTNVPSKYIGMEMIKTPNDDKGNTCGSGYMEFTMPKTATVYIAYDRRATDLPDWINGFNDTGDRINVSRALQGWMTVYSKQFSGGECVNFGCNKGRGFSGSSINNYIVFYGTSGSEQTGGSSDNCDLDAKFHRTTVQNGMNYYTDRSFSFTNVPSKYIGMEIIKTPNDDKSNTCGSDYMEFTMSNTAKVYVAYDRRATDLPDWMNGFNDTGDRINVSRALQGWMTVYSKQFSGGECVGLGCNKGPGSSGSSINNYIVIVGD